jgi:Putative peptidoglycan binding domain/D-alanyl-D-alanine carboxypeptidase
MGAASQNGRLSPGVLSPINGGFLRADAARAFNAFDRASRQRYNVALHPLGHMSSYRTYSQQVALWQLYQSGRGNLAAYPGTSNHGWGVAVDFATTHMRWIVDQIGAHFGWSKAWSDAPSEWWHIRYRPGVWGGASAGTAESGHDVLTLGSHGQEVATLQHDLDGHGVRVSVDGVFGPHTALAVRHFQASHHLVIDGIVGPLTWRALGH